MLLQNIIIAFASIKRNKVRSILTMLGIIIGIASVVTVMAIGDGLKRQVKNEVDGLGVELVTITPLATGEPLREKDVDLVRQTGYIKTITPAMYVRATPIYGSKEFTAAIATATKPEIADIITQKLGKGRYYSADETGVVVIGNDVAVGLFGNDDPIDKVITLRRNTVDELGKTQTVEKTFKVVGVYKKLSKGASFGPGSQLDTAIYLPWADGKIFNDNVPVVDEINAKVKNSNELREAKSSITESLKKEHKGKEDFNVYTSEDVAKSFSKILGIITNFVIAISAVALLVGGIGIMNIMLTTVTERTREIGIRKAIGASRSTILVQFLIEAMVLTLIGGIVGMGLAYVLSFGVQYYTGIPPQFSVQAFILAITITMLVGIVFGIAPAIKASRKKPVDALHYE